MRNLLKLLEHPPQDLSRRDFLKVALGAAAVPLLLSACGRRPKGKTLNFCNWSSYIGRETLPGFERETGIKVNYEMYSDEDEMFAKLRTGVRGYDLLVIDDYQVPKLKALGLIDPLPKDGLRGLENIERRFADPPYDPGLHYTVPYLWGSLGIGYNRKHIPAPPDSWKTLWDERYKNKITMLDNVRDGIGCALLTLGLPGDSGDPEHLRRAKELLVRQKALLKHYSSATYIDELVSGEAWLCQGWSGDVLQAVRENPQIDYVIPREGSFLYVSSFVMVGGSEHTEEALAFLNYCLRPKVAAEIANTVRYATPNAKAQPYLDKTLLADRRVFPDAKSAKRLRFYGVLKPEVEDLWARTWQEVKVA